MIKLKKLDVTFAVQPAESDTKVNTINSTPSEKKSISGATSSGSLEVAINRKHTDAPPEYIISVEHVEKTSTGFFEQLEEVPQISLLINTVPQVSIPSSFFVKNLIDQEIAIDFPVRDIETSIPSKVPVDIEDLRTLDVDISQQWALKESPGLFTFETKSKTFDAFVFSFIKSTSEMFSITDLLSSEFSGVLEDDFSVFQTLVKSCDTQVFEEFTSDDNLKTDITSVLVDSLYVVDLISLEYPPQTSIESCYISDPLSWVFSTSKEEVAVTGETTTFFLKSSQLDEVVLGESLFVLSQDYFSEDYISDYAATFYMELL